MAKIGNEPIDFSITAQSVPIVTNLYCHMINAAIIFLFVIVENHFLVENNKLRVM